MSTPNLNCNEGASKSNDDGICEVNDSVKNMSTTDDNDVSICANCDKEGSDVNNTCNKCKSVMYCNAACKKKHRHKHKKDCEEHQRLAAERTAKLHDEKLFKQPPMQDEDCPICLEHMPLFDTGSKYKTCCGKTICSGCIYAVQVRDRRVGLCPFCRVPTPTSEEEMIELTKKRMKIGDPIAIHNMGGYYNRGVMGFKQNSTKALELWHKAGELGYAPAYNNIGSIYLNGAGVEADKKKAKQYYEMAALKGHAVARHNLGCIEYWAGNTDRALKHWLIAVGGGEADSLKRIQQFYSNGLATKDVYKKSLHAYQEYLNEIKNAQRDEAAAFDDDFKYID